MSQLEALCKLVGVGTSLMWAVTHVTRLSLPTGVQLRETNLFL